VGATLLGWAASWLVRSVLKIPLVLQVETLSGFYLMAVSLPLVISTASLRGILEAHQRFDLTNAVGGITGVFIFLAPLLALSFSHRLPLIVGCLLAGRLIAWGANLLLCLRVVPSLRHGIIFKRALLKPLISFGGWMTVSSIVGPLMVYLDRFLIGALISIAAVAYYATPYELVTKLLLIPAALSGVLFPAISASYFTDRSRVTQLFLQGVKYLFLTMVPLSLIIVTLAHEGLQVWLGVEFAEKSTVVLQWLAIGVLINSLALMPLAMLQGAGRPDLTAKLHLLELPVYLICLIWALKAYGIEGAAFAWVLRVGLDAAFLFYLAKKILPSERLGLRNLSFAMAAVLLTYSLAPLLTSLTVKSIFLGITLTAFASTTWFLILSSREKAWMRNHLKVLKPAIIGRSFDR
jgi:O-antigen/teichoic acid export membrane protein